MDYDLIVIGCGAAGLSAAVSHAAARPGARIAVLERAGREGRGGATRWTSSWLRITADRRLDPAFIGTMEQVSEGKADLDYCRTLEREARATLDFLEAHGVNLIYFPQPFANRNTGGGLGMPSRGGVEIVDALAAKVDATFGSDILYETEAVRLIHSGNGTVTGVVVRGPDGAERPLSAPAVVIACGGFEGSHDMLAEHLGPRGRELPVIAPTLVNNTGDGLRMAQEAGGDAAGQFDMFHGEPIDARSSKPDAVVYAYPFGIVVNRHAQRFFDEGRDSFDSTFEDLGYEIWKNQEQKAFFIADQGLYTIPGAREIILTDQPPIEADSLAELAGKLGLDAAALEKTVADYNASIGPEPFDQTIRDGKAARLPLPKSNWALPIEKPPFIGYPLTCAITFTFGGVRTDSQARVLTRDGAPIPGLYAAGEVTGLFYRSYPAGTSVLRSAAFGRIAGAHAAALARQDA
ncbi:MAG: FAD-dependent oxidoreductase [Sphingomonadales bacterium]